MENFVLLSKDLRWFGGFFVCLFFCQKSDIWGKLGFLQMVHSKSPFPILIMLDGKFSISPDHYQRFAN